MKGFLCTFFFLILLLPFSARSETLEKPIFYESRPQKFNVSAPQEQRDLEYIRFLGLSVKIYVEGASGSGTICHYDDKSGFAHVISCGHLWSGNMEYDKDSTNRPKAKIITWYKNKTKLDSPETFEAEVLFWSNDRGYDVSLLKFKPDWVANFAPIDGIFNLEKDLILNSLGCDGGKEVARYEVIFSEYRSPDIITVKNSPRPGRSGGGLITNSGKLVGVCWGTSDISSGNGIGYFTPVSSIRKVFERNNHGWLLDLLEFRFIPIIDRDNPDINYESGFIPFPGTL